ncbi:hypothetical protein FACS1894104_0340 [Actinomycetota bacterium]|nr:hypothetical protein FACS1894104_0340 [Actinomycetota bacterium]
MMQKVSFRLWCVTLSFALICSFFVPSVAAFADDSEIENITEPNVTEDITGGSESVTDLQVQALQESDNLTKHAVNIVSNANGTITADLSEATLGSTVTLTITPDNNCGLVPNSIKVLTDSQKAPRVVRGDGSAGNPFTFTMPDDSVTVTAQFLLYRNIDITPGIQHGQILTNIPKAVKDDVITISVVPEPGYRLKFNSLINQANKSLVFVTDPNNPVYYEVADKGGSPYARVQITVPDYGTAIGQGALNCNNAATEYYFYMPNADVTLTAEFVQGYDVNIAENMTGGTINLSGRTKAAVGEFVSVAPTAAAGYKLKDGTVRVIDDSTGTDAVGIDANGDAKGYTNNYGFIMPNSSVTIQAEFEQLPPLEVVITATAEDTAVALTVTPVTAISWGTMYYAEAGTTEEVWGTSVNLGAGATGTYTINNLKNGTEYEFWVSANGSVSQRISAIPVGIPITSLSFSSQAVDTMVGKEVVLALGITPQTSKDKPVWTSSDESVATVEQNGRILALALGTTTITATAESGASATSVITVKDALANPVGGSMVIGDANVDYDESGGTTTVPFTVVVPTNKPNYRFVFTFATATTLQYSITGISLNGTPLQANTSNEIDDLKIQLGALPHPTTGSSIWATATPKEGRFLTPGKTYQFTLNVNLLGTATPTTPVTYSNMGNNTSFFYYDPDYDNRGGLEVRQTGTIYANYTGTSTEPPTSGTGANMVYNLSTAAHLLWYANKWNTDSDFNFGATLYTDIDLTGSTFNGIGTSVHPYSKNFNGSNHTVTYNLTDNGSDAAIGFIRYFNGGSNNQISGLTTAGTLLASGSNVRVGGIVGEMTGSAYIGSGCVNNVNITVTGTGATVGGIVGYTNSTYSSWNPILGQSINNGTVNAQSSAYVGGIGGYVKCIAELNETVNNGAVTGSGYVGGIVGYIEYAATGKRIGSNTNNAAITSLGGQATGGIAGQINQSNVGGYWARSGREDGNLNYGNVTAASKYVAGIAGYVDDTAAQFIVMNYNEGNVTSTYVGEGFVAGVLAYLTGSENLVISGNISKGFIDSGTGNVAGGIIAKINSNINPSNCTDNYYAEQNGLLDAVSASTAPNSFLSLNGWAPNYSGSPDDDGSATKPYKLANDFDIIWFASQVNGGTESDNRPIRYAYVELVANIDLTAYPAFEGIGVFGVGKQTFHGTFDGKGHTITLALDASAAGAKYDNAALFQQTAGATIKNLEVAGSVKSKPNAGSAAGVALGSGGSIFENVTNRADITAFGLAGGVTTGDWNGPDRLINVKNYGTIIGGNAAGIVTQMGGQCVVENCENYGDVTAYGVAAGIVGLINGGSKSNSGTPSYYFRNCINNGTITSLSAVTHDSYNNQNDQSPRHTAGGIIGTIAGAIVDINNCTNNGLVQSAGNSAGGIVGSGKGEWNIGAGETSQMTDIRITNSTNNGDVRSTYNGDDPNYLERIGIGGIIGQTGEYDWTLGNPGGTQGLTLIGNVNNGIISGPDGANVGTIVGVTDTGKNSSGGKVTIVDNWSSTVAVGGGKIWGDPRYRAPDAGIYNPDTHYVVDGRIVERNPQTPITNPQNPSNTTNTTTNTSATDLSAPTVGITADGVDTNRPAASAATQNPSTINPTDTPTSDFSSTGTDKTPTFFEIVSEAVVNNPIVVVAIIIAAAALAFAGGIWRYRRNERA